MKKKVFICILCIVVVLSGITIYAYNHDFFRNWGNYLNENDSKEAGTGDYTIVCKSLKPSYDEYVSMEDIYAVGKEVLVTKTEFLQAREFYVLAGSSEKEADDIAYDYVLRNATLYVEAIKNGISVSEDEVNKKIDDLKGMLHEANNADEMKRVIEGFDSEEAYWEYEKKVYQKSLPIEKYRVVLEKDFQNKTETPVGTEEFQAEWREWYKNYQDEKIEQQNFVRTDDEKELSALLRDFRS